MSKTDRLIETLLQSGAIKVNRKGEIFSFASGKWKKLSSTPHRSGALLVSIPGVTAWTHRVVAIALVQRVTGYNFVGHIDGDIANNKPSNLFWTTPKRTSVVAHNRGKVPHPVGRELPSTKLYPKQVLKIRTLLRHCVPHREIGAKFGVTKGAVQGIAYNKTWRHLKGEI